MCPDLPKGVLYAHHFSTQISPVDSYIYKQIVHACIVANSSSVWLLAIAVAAF